MFMFSDGDLHVNKNLNISQYLNKSCELLITVSKCQRKANQATCKENLATISLQDSKIKDLLDMVQKNETTIRALANEVETPEKALGCHQCFCSYQQTGN